MYYQFDPVEGGYNLVITGEGAIPDYVNPDDTPWGEYRNLIKGIVVSDGVTYVGKNAFALFGEATSVTIADSVTSIGNQAFCESGLTSVTLPAGITSVGEGAFRDCTGMTSATIPDSVTVIGKEAFHGCVNLKDLYISAGLEELGDYAFCESGLTSVTLPAGITSVGEGAFRDCTEMTSASIPDSVTVIGKEAFRGCTNLKDLYISAGLVELGDDAFGDLEFYSSDGTTLLPKDVAHLRGARFTEVSGKLVLQSSGGGPEFPLWIPAVIAIAAIGAATCFLISKRA